MLTERAEPGFRAVYGGEGGSGIKPPKFFWQFVLIIELSSEKHALQNIQNDCYKVLSDSCRVHQISFRPGLCPGPRWGSSRRSPRPPSWLGRGTPLPIPTPSTRSASRSRRRPRRRVPKPPPKFFSGYGPTWFSHILRHPARKRSGFILTTPEPTWSLSIS